jgi:hypothetical protein
MRHGTRHGRDSGKDARCGRCMHLPHTFATHGTWRMTHGALHMSHGMGRMLGRTRTADGARHDMVHVVSRGSLGGVQLQPCACACKRFGEAMQSGMVIAWHLAHGSRHGVALMAQHITMHLQVEPCACAGASHGAHGICMACAGGLGGVEPPHKHKQGEGACKMFGHAEMAEMADMRWQI